MKGGNAAAADPETGEVKDGGEVIPDALDLFNTIPTQTGIKQTTTEIAPTKDALQNVNNVITFKFSSDSKSLIDPRRVYVYIVSRIVQKTDGANIAEANDGDGGGHRPQSNVLFVNGLSYAWFKHVNVKINSDDLSSSGTQNYAFRGDLQTRLGNTVEVKQGPLQSIGFFEESIAIEDIDDDAAVQFNTAMRGHGPFTHPAIIERYRRSVNSRPYETYGHIHADIFEQTKLLPPNTQVEISFTRNDSDFVLLAKDGNIDAKAVIDYMHVEYTRVEPEEEYLESIKAQLYEGKEAALYPINRVRLEEYTIAPGQTNFGRVDLFPTEEYIPRRVFVVFVRSSAVTLGNITQDPFNYQSFNIRSVGLKVGNKYRPRPPYKCDFEHGKTLIPLKMLHDAINCDLENFDCGINLSNYNNRNCFFAFDLLNTYTDSGECFERSEKDRIDLEIEAAQPKEYGIKVLVYGEFDAEIEIKPKGGVVMHENA